MTTSEHFSQVPLTLSREVFHAKESAKPERSEDLQTSEADCGLSSCESFAKWDQDSLSWKTHQRSLIEDWAPFLRKSQGTRSGMAAIMGRWPGDETEEEIEAALEHIS